ncbi:unnamed protein product [Cyclocybe aegerita]|uniref:RING-type domain-containing protein n=1 Tax=Cyclocybe aegerita TaxID=1973307 RepID=A0A8S0XEA6_CYCAE|nr:unnamed protein product [Cyclocybe aegerita]
MDREQPRVQDAFAAAAAFELVQDALVPPHERIRAILESLPVLGKDSVDLEEPCPICLVPFETVFEEDKEGSEQREGEDQHEPGLGGVTKLIGCGHIFCRRDLTEWIRSHHGSCPTCRHTFLNIRPPSESDDESSDGGEYIPNPDEIEEDDGFTDADVEDFSVEGMDIDFDELWEEPQEDDAVVMGDEDAELHSGLTMDMEDEDEDDPDYEYEESEVDRTSEWGLTDGESESMSSSMSEGDLSMSMGGEDRVLVGGALEREVSVSVHEDEDANGEEGEGLNPGDLVSQDPK